MLYVVKSSFLHHFRTECEGSWAKRTVRTDVVFIFDPTLSQVVVVGVVAAAAYSYVLLLFTTTTTILAAVYCLLLCALF